MRRTSAGGGSVLSAVAAWPPPSVGTTSNSSSVIRTRSGPDSTTVREGPVMPAAQPIVTSGISGQPITNDRYVARSERNSRTTSADGSAGLPPQPSSTSVDERRSNVRSKRLNFELRSTGTSYSAELGLNELIPFPSAFVSPSSSGSSPFSLPTPTLTTCQLYENDSTSKRSETSHNFIPAESRRQQYQRPVNLPSAGPVTSLSCVRHRTLSLPSTSFVQSSSAGKSGSENLYPLSVSVDKPEVLLSQGNRRQSAGEATGRAVGTRGNSRQLPVPVRQSPLEFGEIKVKPSGERTERPTVVIKPRTQLVECGSTAKFRVAFEGRPEPAVAWIRKGTELRQSDKYLIYESRGGVHVLEVLNANHDDQDVYECIITNQVGTVSCQAELVVYGTSVQPKAAQGRQPSTSDEVIATRSPLLLSATRRPTEPEMTSQPPTTATVPPAFDRKPKSESVTEGDVVKWVCLVRGTPEVLITWEKDGKEVDTNSDRFKLQKLEPGTWTLVVDPVSSSDAGRYVCVARNQFGEARCTFSLMVSTSYRSMSSYKPSPISSNRNTSSAPVSREEQSPVNRPQNVQQTSTSGGGNLPEARPNSAPSKSPSSLSSASNDPSSSKTQSTSVSIFLSSKSSATTKVQATSSEITSPPDGSVDLELCAETKHAGNAETIVVEKSSEISFASHKAVTSTVNNTSSVFMEGKLFQTGEQTVVLLTSDCSRNENEILGSTSSGVSCNETDEYDVTPTRNDVTSDFAFNTCDHDNEKEADETCDQSELFANSPEVVRTPTISGVTKSVDDDDFVDVKPTLRDSAVDSCEALDELPDDSDDVITDVVGTEASMVDLEDDGNVDENGDEDEGVLQTGTADAPGPPFISDVVPDNVHILRGTTLHLKAIFTAQPLPEAIWFKDNSALVPDERTTMSLEPGVATLTIFNTTPSDTGRFAIELSNEFGTERMFSSVTIEDRPEPPVGQPAVTNVTRTSAVLSWSGCSYDGGCTILGYRIEQLLEAENPQNHGLCSSQEDRNWRVVTDCCEHTSFQVHNLRPNTEYRFRVSSVNKHGYSDPGQPSEIAVTIDRKPSVQIGMRADNDDDDDVNKSLNFQPPTPLDMLDPLSPESLMAIRAEMPFEHREVVIVPGRKFDDFYTRGEEIGRGKFGNVTKCEDKSKSMTLAAKFIRMKPSQREEFKREITVMNLLRHPKVLLLWDAFESPRELVLVMEYVGGQELLQRIISDDYMLTERECIHFLRQICEGVGYIHSRGVLHLDMKPENILCISQNSNEIKIIDFGLAQVHSKLVKLMAGTAEFIAPEVINFDDFSYATDMWSVGVICYLLLSGFSPFAGETEQETLGNVTAGEYDFDCEEFRIISDDAKDFITKLLVQQPKNRMLAAQCLEHRWLSQDVSYMRAKRLSTSQHKKFMAKRKWQKTGNAVKALIRMTDLQRLAAGGSALTTRSTCGSDKSNSDRKSMFSTHSAPLVTTGTTSGAARRTTGGKNPSRSCVRLSLDAETLMTSQPVNDVEGATNQPSGNDHESGSIKSVTTGNIMTDISAANIIIYPNIV